MALAHFLLDEINQAQDALQKALADNPQYLPGLRLRAAIEAARGDLQQARTTSLLILQLNPAEKIANIYVVRYSRNEEDRDKIARFLRFAGLP